MEEPEERILTLPDLGDFDDIEVIEILAEPGAQIAAGDSIMTIESEKAAMELPAQAAGVVKELHVALGDKVVTGTPLLTIAASERAVEQAAPEQNEQNGQNERTERTEQIGAAQSAATDADHGSARAAPPAQAQTTAPVRAGPSVRRFARELGVDVGAVAGSGPKGRIVEQDIKDFVRKTLHSAVSPSLPTVRSGDYSRFGPVEIIEPDRIQAVVAERVRSAWLNVPHVTQHDEADVTDLEQRRKLLARQTGETPKLTLLAFLIKAIALSLRDFPRFNTAFDAAGRLIQKRYCHVGVAMDVPGGLFIPVIRDADQKDVYAIARAIHELAARARAGELAPADLQGGCITISNQGGIGGGAFTPIVNAPEVAILGVSRARMTPSWDGRAFVPRLMLPLDLSYDHRVINGADAARFLNGYRRLLRETHLLPPDAR